jgi:ABC-type polysaccharide/polyol phosphate export permease
MAVAAAGFGWRPAVDGAPFAISAALSLVAFASMALVLAPAFVLIRLVPGLTNALESPLYLLCAFMFPATQLPSPIRWIGGALAPSWTTRALFAATDPGAHGTPYAAWWLAAAGLVLANLAVSALLMSRVDRRLRVTGELASV